MSAAVATDVAVAVAVAVATAVAVAVAVAIAVAVAVATVGGVVICCLSAKSKRKIINVENENVGNENNGNYNPATTLNILTMSRDYVLCFCTPARCRNLE